PASGQEGVEVDRLLQHALLGRQGGQGVEGSAVRLGTELLEYHLRQQLAVRVEEGRQRLAYQARVLLGVRGDLVDRRREVRDEAGVRVRQRPRRHHHQGGHARQRLLVVVGDERGAGGPEDRLVRLRRPGGVDGPALERGGHVRE